MHAKHYYEWEYDHEASKPDHPAFKGYGLATNFAPDNIAFAKLPEGLKRFLFSPFGGNVLAKILMYHYVPKTLLLSELLYTEKSHHHHHDHHHNKTAEVVNYVEDGDKGFKKELEVPTALANSTLHVSIEKSKVPLLDGKSLHSALTCKTSTDMYRRLQDRHQGKRPLCQGFRRPST